MKNVVEPDLCPNLSVYNNLHHITYDIDQDDAPKVTVPFGGEGGVTVFRVKSTGICLSMNALCMRSVKFYLLTMSRASS